MSLTWTELEDGLAGRLPYLAVLDTFVLEIENTGALIQLRQEHDHLRSESWPFRHRFADTVVPPETSQALLALGWAPPAGPDDVFVRKDVWPLAPSTGRDLAALLIRTLRDVFAAADPAGLVYRGWNDTDDSPLPWPFLADLRRTPSS